MILVDSSVWIDYFNGRETPETNKLDWQNSRSMQQCKKAMILDLGNNLFFAISNIYKDNISTFSDSEYGIRVQEDASFAEGWLFEIQKRELIRYFEQPFEPKQLSLL